MEQRGQITHMERENASLEKGRDELSDILTADRSKHEKMDSFVNDLKTHTDLIVTDSKQAVADIQARLEKVEVAKADAGEYKMCLILKMFLYVIGVCLDTRWYSTKPWSRSIMYCTLSTVSCNNHTNNDIPISL